VCCCLVCFSVGHVCACAWLFVVYLICVCLGVCVLACVSCVCFFRLCSMLVSFALLSWGYLIPHARSFSPCLVFWLECRKI